MDITGFNEQVGFLPKINLPKINLKNPFPKNLPQTNFLKKVAQQTRPIMQQTVKPSGGLFSAVKKAAQQSRPIMQQTVKPSSGLFNAVKKAAQQTGKSIIVKTPTGIKKLTPKTSFNLVPTASKAPTNFFKRAMQPIKKDEVKKFENTLQAMPASQQAKTIFNLPPTPEIVKNLTPTQRSFLKTDLPYQVISKNNFGQPTTKVIKNTPLRFNINIDQIQPPVDGGISNYYGK